MSDKLTLTIELGNAEMSTTDHVAALLRDVAARVERFTDLGDLDGMTGRDSNGNTVANIALEA